MNEATEDTIALPRGIDEIPLLISANATVGRRVHTLTWDNGSEFAEEGAPLWLLAFQSANDEIYAMGLIE
ncbi:MAG: hypothetical protein WBQ57_13290 [Rhodanobacteraceae bacterium]